MTFRGSESRQRRDWEQAVSNAVRGDHWKQTGRLVLSLAAYQRAITKWPAFPEAFNNLGTVLMSLGRMEEAVRCLRQALHIRPDLLPARCNLLLALLHSPARSPEAAAEAHRQWGRQFPAPPPAADGPAPAGRIRLGYVSANFLINPEGFVIQPLLRHHDRSRFEIFCYSNALRCDEWTRRYQRLAEHWRDISHKSDEQAARLIRRDGIQILVDCSGHWNHGRLSLFSLKPAPIQVSLPTYPATTGLAAVDYRITDRQADPRGLTEHLHTEKLIRLLRVCITYQPPSEAPDVNHLPALENGHVTYGCFNRRQKITDEMLRLWATILKRVPGSRLLFHHTFGGRKTVVREITNPILSRFAGLGVDPARIRFLGRLPLAEHLRVFHQVDLCLDTFPYHGMTMTCESLWMGVPVITLAGRSHVSRIGVSLLTVTGLEDFIAHSRPEYIRIAIDTANDLERLARLRTTLRERMRRSSLTHADHYARALERAYLRMLAGTPNN